jgi:hypothetical protein
MRRAVGRRGQGPSLIAWRQFSRERLFRAPLRQADNDESQSRAVSYVLNQHNCLTACQSRSTFVLSHRNRGVRMSDPSPTRQTAPDRSPAAHDRMRSELRTHSAEDDCATVADDRFPAHLSQGARGTGMRRNLLESLDSGAGTAPSTAGEEVGRKRNPAASQPAGKSRFASRNAAFTDHPS